MDTRRHGVHHLSAYRIFCLVVLFILAFLFLFPLYWIVTGAFKTAQEVNSVTPVWWPQQWTMANFQKLMSRQSAPLWEIHLPFSSGLTKDGSSLILSAGPVLPAAVRWLINTVFMSLMAMILTCVTATMAGYALAKKRFAGQTILFALIVAAMALPKQVITIPLIREMSNLKLYNTIWAVIFPTVGWPFGVFLMRQFSETVPQEMLEAARIDGASHSELERLLHAVNHALEHQQPDDFAWYREAAGRELDGFRTDYGRRRACFGSDPDCIPDFPEILYTGNCHGRGQRIRQEIRGDSNEKSGQIQGNSSRILRML